MAGIPILLQTQVVVDVGLVGAGKDALGSCSTETCMVSNTKGNILIGN